VLTACTEDTDCAAGQECSEYLNRPAGDESSEDAPGASEGTFCADSYAGDLECYTDVEVVGLDLYISCRARSVLVACIGDLDCTGEGELCSVFTFELESGDWAAAAESYCTSDCWEYVEDLGINYYASCPAVSGLDDCDTAADCDSETQVCVPYLTVGDDGLKRVPGTYCTEPAWCYNDTLIDSGLHVQPICDTREVDDPPCTRDRDCDGDDVKCQYYLFTSVGSDDVISS